MSYFRMIENLVCVFFICSILVIPTIYLNYQGNAYEKDTQLLTKVSLGNLGHAESFCFHEFLGLKGNVDFTCRKGEISKIKTLGLMPTFGKDQKFSADYCDVSSKVQEINECT